MNQRNQRHSWAIRVYRLLLKLYPRRFRQEYETEMLQVFTTYCRICGQSNGWWGLLFFYMHTLLDLLVTSGQERWHSWMDPRDRVQADLERSYLMLRPVDEYRPFMEEMTNVMDRQPDYYHLFVTQIESLESVGTMADCLALDGNLGDPSAFNTLFWDVDERGQNPLGEDTPRWLARLCGAVRQSLVDVSPGPSATMTSRLIERIYANPALFELVAAEEVGQRLVDVVESLALDGNAEETDTMLGLMQELGAGDGEMG